MIHNDFSLAANKYPNNIALWSDGQALSYEKLNQLSNSLSCWLNARLPGQGHRIAVLAPKSFDAIIAILAILKSANTYVPLGENWSDGRLSKICQDGQFSLVITFAENANLPLDNKNALITGSPQWQEAIEYAPDNKYKAPIVTADSLAYVLYTSGSTGTPKGVCVSHRAARHFPNWAQTEFHIGKQDRIASVSPLTFDLSTFDLFATLASGATLYIVPERLKVFPARLSEFLQEHQITIIYAVPSTLILLTQRGKLDKRNLNAMKTVLFAGEEFPVTLFKQFRDALPAHINYCNLYGPTETNVCSYYHVPENLNFASMPIGQALTDTHLFIRDEPEYSTGSGRGELCVAGPTVMSGYHGQDNSSAQYWLKDPRGIESRAYATGDQVSITSEKVWNYHGRLDKMVKIWGYRVELGEIESCLRELDNVEQAAVVKRSKDEVSGDKLIAFVQTGGNFTDSTAEVIAAFTKNAFVHCKKNLPAYMVPSQIKLVNKLQLNGTGKIDRLHLENLINE